jgi:hypothetical protein
MRSCYNSWDIFYAMFRPVYQKLGRLVPIVMSVGNHDVGFDAIHASNVTFTNEDLPLFFLYNPQHLGKDGKGVPAILERRSYHYHKIGPSLHLNLDSGYISTHEAQVAWISQVLTSNPGYYPFANYHNPIYPVCADQIEGSNDDLVIKAGTKHWLPLFDKWGFTAVMEHHTHYRKLSYRLKNSSIDETYGTRYVGDGSWGVPNMTCTVERTPAYMDKIESYSHKEPNHYWQLIISKTADIAKPYSISYTAIDMGFNVASKATDSLLPLK